jgi:hypothetical protein
LKRPADIRLLLQRRFANQHRDWLTGATTDGNWPLEITLGIPTESQALQQPDAVRAWVSEWRSWRGAGDLAWTERQWRSLGAQRLPSLLRLDGPDQIAVWAGEQDRWALAQQRCSALSDRWPMLRPYLGKLFDVLAGYAHEDYERLVTTLAWLHANPRSGFYLRQLPIAGLDSKWIEPRRGILAELVAALQDRPGGTQGFYELCGLKRPPRQVRIRILDPALRAAAAGLGDITAPASDLAQLRIAPRKVLIVENLQTGLALQELPDTVAIMGLGYGVDILAALPWLDGTQCLYWGDIDTHGFAILSIARSTVPQVRSLLMDEETLLRHRDLWSQEPSQHGATELGQLTQAEAQLYGKLKGGHFAQAARLEQERIEWAFAWSVIKEQLGEPNR